MAAFVCRVADGYAAPRPRLRDPNEQYRTLKPMTCSSLAGASMARASRAMRPARLSVLLMEQEDLAQPHASASTKLIHGGLRYLEYYEFRLVREALIERERLLGMAPHIIWPLAFVLPQMNSPRPAWLVRLGLFLYDHLGGRKKLPGDEDGEPCAFAAGKRAEAGARTAFVYSDCWVEDSRLVVLDARDAAERGARIETRTKLVSAAREGALWKAEIAGPGGTRTVLARGLVNAARTVGRGRAAARRQRRSRTAACA